MAQVGLEMALKLVKARLNRLATDTSQDEYLMARLMAAKEEIERTGIDLTDGMDDMLLLVDYTVWAYQARDAQKGMPDWLRLRRRERWLGEHAAR